MVRRYRYYSTQRPVMPGGIPESRNVLRIHGYDRRRFVGEIGREAWGWIEYSEPLGDADVNDYELVKAAGNIKED